MTTWASVSSISCGLLYLPLHVCQAIQTCGILHLLKCDSSFTFVIERACLRKISVPNNMVLAGKTIASVNDIPCSRLDLLQVAMKLGLHKHNPIEQLLHHRVLLALIRLLDLHELHVCVFVHQRLRILC